MSHPLGKDTLDLAEDARRLLADLDREVPGVAQLNAECRPPLDVLETATAVEIVIDVPGVPADSIRVAIRRSTLLVVGAKAHPALSGPDKLLISYHVNTFEFDEHYQNADIYRPRFITVPLQGAGGAAQASSTVSRTNLNHPFADGTRIIDELADDAAPNTRT